MTNDVIKLWEANKQHMRLLLDSGAFTNWKAGRDSSVERYTRFIKDLPIQPWRYFSLDRIGDPVITEQNQRYMTAQGLNPIPIFTRGTDPGEIEKLYETSDLVGIGVGVGSNNHLGYLKWMIKQNGGRPLHWLGVTNSSMIASYKPYSCDASSWETGGRYGSIPIYLGGGKFQTYRRAHAMTRPPEPGIWKVIRGYGFDPRDLQKEEHWRGGKSVSRRLGCASWVRYALDVEEQFQTRVFLALTTSQGLGLCLDAYSKDRKVAV